MISLIMLNYVMVNLGFLFKNILYGSQASHPQNYVPKRPYATDQAEFALWFKRRKFNGFLQYMGMVPILVM